MKKLILCMVLLVMPVGCLPEARDVQTFSKKAMLFSEKVDTYQKEMGDIIDLLKLEGIIKEELAVKIDKANEEIDRVQPQMLVFAKALQDAGMIEDDGFGNYVRLAKAGTTASTSWNPYAAPILLGLSLLEGIVLLLVNRSKKKEANKRQADKEGREKTLREIATLPDAEITAPIVKSMMYNNIGDARKAIT